jgi:hypothetical protein
MPRAIYPSALHWASVCPRRFVGMHGSDQLPPTLGAVRGRILHAVREKLAAHPDRSAAALRAAAEPAFVAAITQEQRRLAKASWWVEWFDLAEHLPWRLARSLVLPLANRLASMPAVPNRSRPRVTAHTESPAVRGEPVTDSLARVEQNVGARRNTIPAATGVWRWPCGCLGHGKVPSRV